MTFKEWQGHCFVRQSCGRNEMLLTHTSAVLAGKTGHFFRLDYFGESTQIPTIRAFRPCWRVRGNRIHALVSRGASLELIRLRCRQTSTFLLAEL